MQGFKALLLTSIAITGAIVAGCNDPSGSRIAQGCRVPDRLEPVAFVSAQRRLHGVLDVPNGPGPHPVVLLLHDSGQTDITRGKGDFAEIRAALRGAGVASFVWDQPGSGCSGGRYRGIVDLYVRADDVLAAVEALRRDPRLDAERIGAWAIGEGVWPAAMAAARGALDFLVLVGGPESDPIERIRYAAERHLLDSGHAPDEARHAASGLADALAMMRDQAPYRDYRAAIDALSRYPLLPSMSELARDVHTTERRYAELRDSAVLHLSVDVFLAALEIPVLAIWGADDAETDWRRASAAYREAFERAANGNATIRIFDGADHALCAARDEGECVLAEGYLETTVSWLASHGFTGGRERQTKAAPAAQRAAAGAAR